MNENEGKHHYSERLKRAFELDDWLLASEALAVLDTNANRRVSDRVLWRLRERGLRSEVLENGRRVYLYDDLCAVVVPNHAGRVRQNVVNDNARRQREYRERQRKMREEMQPKE